ncbi:MAG TPA: beta-ketoacyl synthase N-terminal-like domain-containing protein [Chryseolinea sp.]
MAVYIKGMGNISPQKTWGDDPLLANPSDYSGSKLSCIEPDYNQFVDVKQLRRMSRIIKMGVAAGTMALREAGIATPDGIITGTSFGCMEDTGMFLSKMIENRENALNPTPFIQSTHNTIGSQIALLLQCQGYNQTYTQRAFSFEHSLIDAILELKENADQHMLVGGMDEITTYSHTLQKRFGIFRDSSSTLDLFRSAGDGTINGEGAVYLTLSGKKGERDIASIDSVSTIYNSGLNEVKEKVAGFLGEASLNTADIDLVLLGKSGEMKPDADLERIASDLFPKASLGAFKHLCGEYPTASAFALWLGARIIREGKVPAIVLDRDMGSPVKSVLIVNSYFEKYHSLILLRAC